MCSDHCGAARWENWTYNPANWNISMKVSTAYLCTYSNSILTICTDAFLPLPHLDHVDLYYNPKLFQPGLDTCTLPITRALASLQQDYNFQNLGKRIAKQTLLQLQTYIYSQDLRKIVSQLFQQRLWALYEEASGKWSVKKVLSYLLLFQEIESISQQFQWVGLNWSKSC